MLQINTQDDLLAFARKIVKALGPEPGGGSWKVEKGQKSKEDVSLVHSSGMAIILLAGPQKYRKLADGRLLVRTTGFPIFDGRPVQVGDFDRTITITISLEKSVEAIATEIERRLLVKYRSGYTASADRAARLEEDHRRFVAASQKMKNEFSARRLKADANSHEVTYYSSHENAHPRSVTAKLTNSLPTIGEVNVELNFKDLTVEQATRLIASAFAY